MRLTNPGFSRVLHERPDYHKDLYKINEDSFREHSHCFGNHGNVQTIHISNTARWSDCEKGKE